VLFGGSDDGTAVSVATGASDNNIAVTKGYVDDAIPVKATGAELTTGTDDAKFATAKAIKDSHNVPSAAPGADGNVLTSDGTDWVSEASVGETYYDLGDPVAPDYVVGDLTVTNAWTDLDLTTIVGAGAKRIHLQVFIRDDDVNLRIIFRKNRAF